MHKSDYNIKYIYYICEKFNHNIMNIPANLKYSSDHEWVKVDGDIATVGITDFAQGQLGDIVFIDIQTEGETLDKSEVFGAIEAVKTVADALMPVSGKIIEVNADLENAPESVNKDPYGAGCSFRKTFQDSQGVS